MPSAIIRPYALVRGEPPLVVLASRDLPGQGSFSGWGDSVPEVKVASNLEGAMAHLLVHPPLRILDMRVVSLKDILIIPAADLLERLQQVQVPGKEAFIARLHQQIEEALAAAV